MAKTTPIAALSGTVTRFQGNGRQLGYPTANLITATPLSDGIYFGFANLADYRLRPALIFIGTPTTVGDTKRRVEAHLLDIPDRDYYGGELVLDIRHYHRPSRTLSSRQALITLIQADEAAARRWFGHNPLN
ncbi:MAG TPA: riboflavin kinase [Candidatus Saccharimonadales bacterium]|nr:riboflavin kinase [Candidatus Saccharimonadales bacterium]